MSSCEDFGPEQKHTANRFLDQFAVMWGIQLNKMDQGCADIHRLAVIEDLGWASNILCGPSAATEGSLQSVCPETCQCHLLLGTPRGSSCPSGCVPGKSLP